MLTWWSWKEATRKHLLRADWIEYLCGRSWYNDDIWADDLEMVWSRMPVCLSCLRVAKVRGYEIPEEVRNELHEGS